MTNISVQAIDNLLPQTQCGSCGYSGCLPYAEAVLKASAPINLCPPGGIETIQALADLLGIAAQPYLEQLTLEWQRKPSVAKIKESECIGCTKCIQACPMDAIVGSGKKMHVVIKDECTGCGLCVEPCPVDCIEMMQVPVPIFDKNKARTRYNARKTRLLRDQQIQQAAYIKNKNQRSCSQNATQISNHNKKLDYILQAINRVETKKKNNDAVYTNRT